MITIDKRQGFRLFGFTIAIIAVTDIAILLNIPVLRQILGVIFLTILPGLLILFLLKLNKLETAEKLVLTIGLSIAFLIFYGWLLNQASLFFGHTSPLSTNTLILWLSLALVALLVAAYIGNKEAFSSLPFSFELNTKGKLCLLLPVTLPLLSIWGTRLLNTSGNNIILLALLLLIPVSFIVITLLRHEISKDTYPIAIIMTAAGISLMFWLRSEHILGADIQYEYYLSRMTLLNQHWSLVDYRNVDACLSVTLLPAIYQSMLQMQGEEYLFQGIHALIWALTPLAVYIVARKYIGGLYALLASFLFISRTIVFASDDARISLAIFFFALAIMVLLSSNIHGARQRGLFLAFIAAIIVSHYSTSYVFFFLLLFTWLLGLVFTKYTFSRNIAVTSVGLFFALIFLWYSQLTQAPFESGVQFLNQTMTNLHSFAIVEAKDPGICAVLSAGTEGIIADNVRYVIMWVTFAFIAVGVVGTLIKRRQMLSAPPWGGSPGWLSSRLETEYFLLALVASAILVGYVSFAASRAYAVGRVYAQMLVVLSPFLVIGSVMLAKCCRLNSHFLILLLLIAHFSLEIGVAQEVSGTHMNPILSAHGTVSPQMDMRLSTIAYHQETRAALWAEEHIEGNSVISSDDRGARLLSEAGVSPSMIGTRPLEDNESDSYIYLNYNNVVNGKSLVRYGLRDLSDLPDLLSRKNKLYGSNGSEVWR